MASCGPKRPQYSPPIPSYENPQELSQFFLSRGLRWRGEQAVRSLMQSFLRMQDPLRIIRFGIEHPEGDGRGDGPVSLPWRRVLYAITSPNLMMGAMGLNDPTNK